MNTFYHFEGVIYETLEGVISATKNYTNKSYDVIETDKNFDLFYDEFYTLRASGNSIIDSIELAK